MLLVGNGKVITRDERQTYFEDGAVLISGGLIRDVGETDAMQRAYPKAEFLDAHGGVIMPGLINVHSHIYSALARGLSMPNYNPHNFYEILDGMWWNIDRHLTIEQTRMSAYMTYIDSIRNGITTLYDHHASYGHIEGSLFAIADVAKTLGIRTNLCYEVSDRDGAKKCEEAIKENAAFIEYTKNENNDMIKAMFGLHAAFTLSDKTLEACVKANDGNAGFHIHVCEGLNDVIDSRDNYNTTTVERLLSHGILGEKSVAGHCIHLTEKEMDILKETDTMVVNNPQSNMGNAVGCSPILDLYAKGILLGLGTDAYTNDMLESLKVANGIQKHNAQMPNVGWVETTSMLFSGNANIVSRSTSKPVGTLEPGALGDIAVFDYRPYTPFSHANIDGHMMFGLSGKECIHTVVNGEIIMKDKVVLTCDEAEVYAKTKEQSKLLWDSLGVK